MLRRVAEVLRDNLRGSDRIGRLGGDEFAILLPRGTADEAVGRGREDRHRAARGPEGGDHGLGRLAGFEGAPHGGRAVLGAADRALYAAKGLGATPGRARCAPSSGNPRPFVMH